MTRTDGFVCVWSAVGVDSARVRMFAWVSTKSVITGLVGSALIVVTTSLDTTGGLTYVAKTAFAVQ